MTHCHYAKVSCTMQESHATHLSRNHNIPNSLSCPAPSTLVPCALTPCHFPPHAGPGSRGITAGKAPSNEDSEGSSDASSSSGSDSEAEGQAALQGAAPSKAVLSGKEPGVRYQARRREQ